MMYRYIISKEWQSVKNSNAGYKIKSNKKSVDLSPNVPTLLLKLNQMNEIVQIVNWFFVFIGALSSFITIYDKVKNMFK